MTPLFLTGHRPQAMLERRLFPDFPVLTRELYRLEVDFLPPGTIHAMLTASNVADKLGKCCSHLHTALFTIAHNVFGSDRAQAAGHRLVHGDDQF
jgi:hypothetical protein